MSNNTKPQNKIKWTNSDLSSLALWYNEGVPVDEIAKRLKKSANAVSNVIFTKKGVLKPRSMNTFEKKSSNELIHHNIEYIENIIFITSIVKMNDSYYLAKAWLADTKLIDSMGIITSEFTTTDACMRWFENIPNQFFPKTN